MGIWTTETALQELDSLIDEIAVLSDRTRYSAEHTRWIMKTLIFLEQVYGNASQFSLSLRELPWEQTGRFTIGGPGDPRATFNPDEAIERRHHQAYLRGLGTAKGLLQAAQDELRRNGIDKVYQGKDTSPESSAIIKIINLAERKLRKTIRTPPSKEREVQDSFENLMIASDIEYSREKDSIEYSSKTYIPDFTVPRLELAIELKLSNRPDREKELIAEVNDDILAYGTKYGNILFIVYDLGYIRDIDMFSKTFEQHEGVLVRVVKQ